jgi:hypothetical protein
MNLSQLNSLAKDFKIPHNALKLQGEHDVVYLMGVENYLPDPENTDEQKEEEIYDKYGIHVIEGEWGCYT